MRLDFEITATDLDLGHARASRLLATSVRKDVVVQLLRFVSSFAFVVFVATAVAYLASGDEVSATALRWLLLWAAVCFIALVGRSRAVRGRPAFFVTPVWLLFPLRFASS